MREINRRAKHHGATPRYKVYTLFTCQPGRILRIAALAYGSVYPHPVDPELRTLSDDGFGRGRWRGYYHAFDLSPNGFEAGVACLTLYLGSPRIDGKDLMTRIPELPENEIGCIYIGRRNSRYSYVPKI